MKDIIIVTALTLIPLFIFIIRHRKSFDLVTSREIDRVAIQTSACAITYAAIGFVLYSDPTMTEYELYKTSQLSKIDAQYYAESNDGYVFWIEKSKERGYELIKSPRSAVKIIKKDSEYKVEEYRRTFKNSILNLIMIPYNEQRYELYVPNQ